MARRPMLGRRGFTILELLVVMAVIAVLIAILCPVVITTRANAQTLQCAANLHSIGGALVGFCADHDAFPTSVWMGQRSDNWVFWQAGRNFDQSALQPYLNKKGDQLRGVFICPAQPLEDQLGYQGGRSYQLTYSINCSVDAYYPIPLRRVKNPPGKIAIYDENQYADDDQFWYATDRDTLAGRHGGVDTQNANLNGGGERSYERKFGNVLWCDWHVSLADNNMCHQQSMNDFMY